MLDLLAIGEVMTELRRADSGEFRIGFAGDTFNTAVYCRRALGQGGCVSYFTRLGLDSLSQEAVQFARGEGLGTESIQSTDSAQIGIYSVATDQTGERSFSYWRDSSAARGLFADEESPVVLPSARITYLSGITLAIMQPSARDRLLEHLAALSASRETLVCFDSNYRPSLWESVETAREVTMRMWGIADIALPSLDDELALFGEADEREVLARFARRDWTACAIKRGVFGPVSPRLNLADTPVFEPATDVVDTTAAGDSFNGGYLAAFLRAKSEAECLSSGHELASKVVRHSGAIVPAEFLSAS